MMARTKLTVGHVLDLKNNRKAQQGLNVLKRIVQIGEVGMRRTPGMQIAGVFEWCAANRDRSPKLDWQRRIISHRKTFDERFRYREILNIQPGVADWYNSLRLPKRRPAR